MRCPFVAQQQILPIVELGPQKVVKMKLSIYSSDKAEELLGLKIKLWFDSFQMRT